MPPKNQRVSTPLFRSLPKGKFINLPHFDLRFGDYPTLKLACVVKSGLFRTSVERNKARRMAYNFLTDSLKGQNGFFIIYPKKSFLTAKKDKIKEDILSFTKK